MVDDRRSDPSIAGLIWDEELGGNVGHIAKHQVKPQDVEEVLATEPRFFTPSREREGCVMLGP